jgi:hypothetical protein
MSRGAALLSIVAALGCSARLSSRPGDGVRVRAPAPYVVTRHVTLLDKSRVPCREQVERDFLNLPFGEPYALNVDNRWSWFSKNELRVRFHDSGNLEEVLLNSDPQLDETLEASAALVEETAKLVTALSASRAGAAAGEPDAASCGRHRDERVECVETFEQWEATPERCK